MGRRKKLWAVLVLLSLCRDSRQEDYEEEVFLNKCQLDTTKIYDSILDLKTSSKSNDDVKQALAKVETQVADVAKQGKDLKKEMRDRVDAIGNATLREIREVTAKTGADLAKAKDDLNATLTDLKMQMLTLKAESEAVVKFVSDYNARKARFAQLKLVRLSTGRYFYHNQSMNHAAARAWCSERGMRVVQFETLEEMKVVLENAPNNNFYSVDASDVGFAPGDFRWSGGAKVETEFWGSGEPNNNGTGKETCVYTYQSYKKLKDEQCTEINCPLCEVPPEFSGCL